MNADHIQALVALGFTALEAEVYGFLLREPAATGYRVAQRIGKPAANTYKAVESLQRKGAVIVDDGESRVCRAVPPAELLGQLDRRFEESRNAAEAALANLDTEVTDDRLYQLRSRAQVLARARAMLDRCQHVAVMDLAPALAVELTESLAAACQRNVEVVIKTYEAIDIEGASVHVRPRGHEITEAIPGEMLSLNVDGSEHLLALMRRDADEVYQAIWTGSAIVSYLFYNGLVNEVSQVAIMAELEKDTSVTALRDAFASLRHLHPISSRGPAYRNLIRRVGVDVETRDCRESHGSK